MIETTSKKQSGREFVKEMENTYNSIEELEELFSKTNDMKHYVDLRNWKHFKNHLDDEIEITVSVISQNH